MINTRILEETASLSLNQFKQIGLLNFEDFRQRKVDFNDGSNILIDPKEDSDGVRSFDLKYSFQGHLKNYSIRLDYLSSNLRKGKVCYFVCPIGENLCRKLYFDSSCGLFVSQKSFQGRYEIQTISPGQRNQESERKKIQANREAVMQLEQVKGIRYYYKGKPTKRYKRLKRMREEHYTSASI